ncbi:MAG: hypothetical protein U0T84_12575 [Chitinophagales bacterium]
MDRNGRINAFCLLLLSALLAPVLVYGQSANNTSKKVTPNYTSTDIYIPLRGREEVTLVPLLDTLLSQKEYRFKIRFSDRYKFAELLFDRGIAVRTDSIIRVVPSTHKTWGYDTSTLRIIGFAGGSRILLFHQFYVEPAQKVYPVIPKTPMNVVVDHLALERNEKYQRDNFTEKSVFMLAEDGDFNPSTIITAITISLIHPSGNKNMYAKADRPTKEMLQSIRLAKPGSLCYIRLDVRNGKKAKSCWTRFTLL